MGTTATSAPTPLAAPQRIERLQADVVNRIAAGEVIHRPANALKELLENSLDAGATQISVTVNQGGLKLLQIQDNGKGIHREDLEIVCERFTTSKLRKFEDLRAISSFGFRGEALASISHVAHVSITSKTADQPCAYKAHYRDGKLIAKQPGGSKDPVPCAGKNGTQIVVEDLFYNLSTRRQAFKNTSEQYQRILDVVQRYAVHFGSRRVGFVCKKHRDPSCDVNTLNASSQLDVIRQIYGNKLSTELIEFEFDHPATSTAQRDLEFSVHGWVSNANFNVKTSNFILFINERLVDCTSLKRACEYVYSLYLPKHTHPFVYLSLRMPPHNLDVNVHPTKREVHFLYEEIIVETIAKQLEAKLKGSNESRVFVVQPITSMMVKSELKGKGRESLPLTASTQARAVESDDEEEEEDEDEEMAEQEKVSGKKTGRKGVQSDGEEDDDDDEEEDEDVEQASQAKTASQAIQINLSQKATPNSKKYQPSKAPQKLVRTDHRSNTIDMYYFLESQRSSHASLSQTAASHAEDEETELADSPSTNGKKRRLSETWDEEHGEPEASVDSSRRESVEVATQSPQLLTSVQNLLTKIEQRKSKALEKMFREHSFVGVVNRQYSLIQYRTKLYLVRHRDIAYHLFYEKVIQQFGHFNAMQLPVPLSVYDLIYDALSNPRNGYDEEDGPKDQLADDMKQLLVANGPMLAEYFALDIDSQGMLRSLPRLLGSHEPSLHSLPEFVFHLATEVNWDEEEPCFENVAQVLAQWYSELWYPTKPEQSALVLEHVLFPATKLSVKSTSSTPPTSGFSPPNELNDSAIMRPIACLTKLYRIFERC
ncbi:hypothetical protein Poli38472_005468 [Pythium oligandrum]|uniref:DNA mismatch repair protein S5 domain-containing protein n=1 Tax=Pythium oligandrum TaxID=41045 RepID=A0A8K1FGJ9_PYTOL|nr:hypothetical protein Poli38472_005468 [Pythium oligandrum]|eukprot:TMW62850.1 hypothetical protein Poli38472_005468 [Pythium oligandrum]